MLKALDDSTITTLEDFDLSLTEIFKRDGYFRSILLSIVAKNPACKQAYSQNTNEEEKKNGF